MIGIVVDLNRQKKESNKIKNKSGVPVIVVCDYRFGYHSFELNLKSGETGEIPAEYNINVYPQGQVRVGGDFPYVIETGEKWEVRLEKNGLTIKKSTSFLDRFAKNKK